MSRDVQMNDPFIEWRADGVMLSGDDPHGAGKRVWLVLRYAAIASAASVDDCGQWVLVSAPGVNLKLSFWVSGEALRDHAAESAANLAACDRFMGQLTAKVCGPRV